MSHNLEVSMAFNQIKNDNINRVESFPHLKKHMLPLVCAAVGYLQ